MKSKVVPLRLPENLLELAAICGQEQRADKATTLRQWLYRGAEDYTLHLVEEGRLSVSRAAELLEMTLYDLYRLAEQKGLPLSATEQQYRASLQTGLHGR